MDQADKGGRPVEGCNRAETSCVFLYGGKVRLVVIWIEYHDLFY